MQLFTMSDSFEPLTIIDTYSSMIWTERMYEVGEIELEFPFSVEAMSMLPIGTWLGLDLSDRVMRVDTVEIDQSEENSRTLKIKGRECSDIFRFRTAWRAGGPLGDNPSWGGEFTPSNWIRYAMRQGIISTTSSLMPNLNSQEVIPNAVLEASDTSAGTIPFPSDPVPIYKTSPTITLEFITEIAKAYHIGWRLYLHKYDGNLYAQTYSGRDRTLGQSLNEPVIFTPSLDNIRSMNLVQSDRNYSQGVRIYTKDGYHGLSREGDGNKTGFEKRVTFHTPPQPDLTGSALTQWLASENRNYLALNDVDFMVDGQISPNSNYRYNVDYSLGDLVDVRTEWGFSSKCRVTEQIFTDDETGQQAYPTLTTETVATPGSWLAETSSVWGSPIPDNTWSER